jgi:hypothetical protein
MSGRMSKKTAWRKLASSQATNVLPEIHDRIAKRLVQTSVTNELPITDKNQLENVSNTIPLFRFDATGASKLGRVTKKHLHRLNDKTLNLSQYHVAAISQAQKTALRRERIQSLDAMVLFNCLCLTY